MLVPNLAIAFGCLLRDDAKGLRCFGVNAEELFGEVDVAAEPWDIGWVAVRLRLTPAPPVLAGLAMASLAKPAVCLRFTLQPYDWLSPSRRGMGSPANFHLIPCPPSDRNWFCLSAYALAAGNVVCCEIQCVDSIAWFLFAQFIVRVALFLFVYDFCPMKYMCLHTSSKSRQEQMQTLCRTTVGSFATLTVSPCRG